MVNKSFLEFLEDSFNLFTHGFGKFSTFFPTVWNSGTDKSIDK